MNNNGNNKPLRETPDGPPVTQRQLPDPNKISNQGFLQPPSKDVATFGTGINPIIAKRVTQAANIANQLNTPQPPSTYQAEQQAQIQSRSQSLPPQLPQEQFTPPPPPLGTEPGPVEEPTISPPPGPPLFGQSNVVTQQLTEKEDSLPAPFGIYIFILEF